MEGLVSNITKPDFEKVMMTPTTPRLLLRVECLLVLAAACLLYARLDYRWSWFAFGFLLPDLFMLGYLVDKKVGAACYNLVHTYATPLLLAGLYSR